jgi:osmotically-inducible protein OsmY
VYFEPPVIVTAPASTDQAINDDVVDTIANDPRISGRIGSDTFNGNVTLNGRVGTPFQAQMAEQDAKSVDGVNDVDNRIRPVVGEH